MWKDSYLIGIELIDNQHKRLFEAITTLKDNLGRLGETHYKKQLQETIVFLKNYCITHFNDEQDYMQGTGFKGYKEHKEKHDKLLGDVGEYGNKLLETGFDHEVVESFLGFLVTWLIYHIGVEDQQIPKKGQVDSPTQKSDGTYQEYANIIKSVLNTLAGLSGQVISSDINNSEHIDSGICYRVRLINSNDPGSIDIIYSESLAYGLVKEMTNIDAKKFVNVMYMALQEISGIIGTKIAGLLSRETKSDIKTGTPKHIQSSDLDITANGLMIQTQIGTMEVFFN